MERGERRMLIGFLGVVASVSALLLGIFAAWGRLTDRPPPPGAKHIVFMGWGGVIERKVFSDLIAEFKRRNPDIDVEYRPVPRDFVIKLKLMFAGGTPPDVFYMPDFDFPSFASAGRLTNLQPFVEQSRVIKPEEFWASSLRRYRYDGRVFGQGALYALPKDIGPTAMFVNIDLLRKAGVAPPSAERPLTWDEAVAFWRKVTRDLDGDGRTDQWGTFGLNLESAVWSNGGDFLSADGRRFVMPDDPRAVEAVDWLVGLQTREHVSPRERHRQSIPVDTMFLTGRLATFVGGRWMVPQFRFAPFQWDVVPIPVSPRTRREAGWSGSVGIAVSSTCRYPEAAWRLVEFLGGPEGQEAQARTGFQIPSQRWMATTEVFLQSDKMPARADVFVDAAAWQQENPSARTPDAEWWDRLNQALAPAYRGEKSVSEALRSARGDVQAALDRAWEKHK
jgi:multiple sugar transport system substrate-binding protein